MADRLILASGSSSRRQMLTAAGLAFEVIPSNVDEEALRRELEESAPVDDDFPLRVASLLAIAKAREVSARAPGALVIGADQVLCLEGATEIVTKPEDVAAARIQLKRLAGRRHWLHAAVALAVDGEPVWADIDSAGMTVRDFSDTFLDAYLARVGENVCTSVGAYQLEGLGVQLFEKIEGDYFTILGMPLVPLLAELRRRKVIEA